MSDLEIIQAQLTAIREDLQRVTMNLELRVRAIESLHDRQRGAWGVLIFLMGAAGAIGGMMSGWLRTKL